MVLLTILKVIGILLLVILGLLLVAVLTVLFVPVRYRAEGAYQGEFWAKGQVTWLLHLLSVRFSFEKGFKCTVKIAGISVFPKQKKKPKTSEQGTKKESGAEEPEKQEEQEEQEEQAAAPDTECREQLKPEKAPEESVPEKGVSEEKAQGDGRKMPDDAAQSAEGTGVTGNRTAGEEQRAEGAQENWDGGNAQSAEENRDAEDARSAWEKLSEKVYAIFRKFGEKYETICAKIKKVKDRLSYYIRILQREETKELLWLTIRQLRGILRHVLPRKLDVRLNVGTGDPASTGQILALQGLLYPVLKGNVLIVPDFEEKRFEGTFYMKGRITAFVLLLCALRVIINKNFRKLIRILRKKEEA